LRGIRKEPSSPIEPPLDRRCGRVPAQQIDELLTHMIVLDTINEALRPLARG
jgi:hypothetical protein